MGLDISAKYSDKEYHYSYVGIHQVRCLGLVASGIYSLFTEEMEKQFMNGKIMLESELDNRLMNSETARLIRKDIKNESIKWHMAQHILRHGWKDKQTWDMYPDMWQLLHFSDCEGILIKDFFLENIDYSNSYYLGSMDRLLSALEIIKDWIARNPQIAKDYKYALRVFWSLYDLTFDECENGGNLTFH